MRFAGHYRTLLVIFAAGMAQSCGPSSPQTAQPRDAVVTVVPTSEKIIIGDAQWIKANVDGNLEFALACAPTWCDGEPFLRLRVRSRNGHPQFVEQSMPKHAKDGMRTWPASSGRRTTPQGGGMGFMSGQRMCVCSHGPCGFCTGPTEVGGTLESWLALSDDLQEAPASSELSITVTTRIDDNADGRNLRTVSADWTIDVDVTEAATACRPIRCTRVATQP